MGTRGSFSWVKQPRHEVNHSPPSSSKVRNEWSWTTTSHICPSSNDRDNFTSLSSYSVNKLPDAAWNGMAEAWVQWHMFIFMLVVIQDITGLPENNHWFMYIMMIYIRYDLLTILSSDGKASSRNLRLFSLRTLSASFSPSDSSLYWIQATGFFRWTTIESGLDMLSDTTDVWPSEWQQLSTLR